MQSIAVIGASGAIGQALLRRLAEQYPHATIHAFARHKTNVSSASVHTHSIDLTEEHSIAGAASMASQSSPLDMVVVASGMLHQGDIVPEKSLRELSAEKFAQLFAVNTIGPALVAKHFLPLLHTDKRAVFAALSARVGSISDNGLGGWYSYRASKAALNMVIKNAAIEMARKHKQMIIIGLHPGTVDSALSQPFQANVPDGKLFSPDYAAECLLAVMEECRPEDSGKCFAWDGQEIAP